MQRRFNVTYDITTAESAERGDCAESGFLNHDGERYPMTGIWGMAALEPKARCAMTLRDAVRLIGTLDSQQSGPSFYEADGRISYSTGEHEMRALHCPDHITAASMARVARTLQRSRAQWTMR